MKRLSLMLLLLCSCAVYCAEDENASSHNTYNGKVITPKTLRELAPKKPEDLKKQADQLMQEHGDLMSELVTTPHPLTRGRSKIKDIANRLAIEMAKDRKGVQDLGKANYVLKFNGYNFTVPINEWGSRMAHLVYATDQGSVLDPEFKTKYAPLVDYTKFEYRPSLQHCSRLAHWLRFMEIRERNNFKYVGTTPTYFKRIPGKPKELSDENYVVIQEWVENFIEIRNLPLETQVEIIKKMNPEALKEMYDVTVYAALWDIANNLGVRWDKDKKECIYKDGAMYIMFDLESPFNHKGLFFKGEEGRAKYAQDVADALERMAMKLHVVPEKVAFWKSYIEHDEQLKSMFNTYNITVKLDKICSNKECPCSKDIQ